MNIPFFNYSFEYKKNEKDYINIFKKIGEKGAFILQKDLKTFETRVSKYLKVKYAIGVANGTDAIWLGLMASNIKINDEIIIPSHTYIATAAAIHMVGAKPILCECDNDGMMDPNDIVRNITKKTRAIMPVQLNGRCCDMDKIKLIAKKYNLKIFEDAAQAFGSRYKKKFAGTFGEFGTISLYPAKLLGCFGDGGILLTNSKTVANKVYQLRDHGRNMKGKVISWGFNSRLDNLQAAILNYKLKNYNQDILFRRKIAKYYYKKLRNNKNLHLPPSPSSKDNFDVYQNYEIQANKRDLLKRYLQKKGIKCLIQWNGDPVHNFNKLGFKNKNLDKTTKYFKNCLMLPMNTSLNLNQLEYVCNTINNFYKNYEKI